MYLGVGFSRCDFFGNSLEYLFSNCRNSIAADSMVLETKAASEYHFCDNLKDRTILEILNV